MKLLSTLAIAALLTTGSALAASARPTATPASGATPAQATRHTAMHCEKEAKAKKLTGDEASKFIKECREGRKD